MTNFRAVGDVVPSAACSLGGPTTDMPRLVTQTSVPLFVFAQRHKVFSRSEFQASFPRRSALDPLPPSCSRQAWARDVSLRRRSYPKDGACEAGCRRVTFMAAFWKVCPPKKGEPRGEGPLFRSRPHACVYSPPASKTVASLEGLREKWYESPSVSTQDPDADLLYVVSTNMPKCRVVWSAPGKMAPGPHGWRFKRVSSNRDYQNRQLIAESASTPLKWTCLEGGVGGG